MPERTRTVGSLFSGIGGIDLGFQRAGFEIAWQVEIDKAARSVLARHWPGVPRFEDIRECGKKQLSKVDVIAGGFPCQDLSVAGNRGGLAAGRSGLFWEMLRITNELKPAFLCWENVPGLLSSDSGRDFARILRGLADIGYFGGWRVCDARYWGVPQRRRRVFGVFARGYSGAERCAEILSLTAGLPEDHPPRRQAGEGVAATPSGRSSGRGISAPGRGGEDDQSIIVAPAPRESGVGTERAGDTRGQDCLIVSSVSSKWSKGSGGLAGDECYNLVAGALGTRSTPNGHGESGVNDQEVFANQVIPVPFVFQTRIARNGRGQPKDTVDALTSSEGGSHADSKPHVATTQGVRRLTPRECERLQGLPDDFSRYDANGKEQKDGPRYRQVGNGVAVPVLEWIARRIAEAL